MVGCRRLPLLQYKVWEVFKLLSHNSGSIDAGGYVVSGIPLVKYWPIRPISVFREPFGVVTIRLSVGNAVRLSIGTVPVAYHVSFKENGGVFVDLRGLQLEMSVSGCTNISQFRWLSATSSRSGDTEVRLKRTMCPLVCA